MIKFLTLLIMAAFMVAFSAPVNGQKGVLKTLATDTVKGTETITLTPIQLNGTYQSLSISVLCTDLGGTPDGYITLLASNDATNYFAINGYHGSVWSSPANLVRDTIRSTMTIYPAAVLNWVVNAPPWRYYKLSATGTAGDTTGLTITYVYK